MISKAEQEHLCDSINNQPGVIYLAALSRYKDFEKVYPDFKCIRTCNRFPCTYEGRGRFWQVVRACESARGHKPKFAIIDASMEKEVYDNIVHPSLLVCSQVEFFD